MKALSLFVLAIATLPSLAQAAPRDWQAELETYKATIAEKSNANLIWRHAGNTTAALGACGTAAAIAGASFVAETFPVANGLSEVVANASDENYETATYNSLLSWEAFMQLARGTAGGGLVAVKDSLKFVILFLSGDTSRSFEGVKKVYASSLATTNKMFAEQGLCMMSLSKVVLLNVELEKRGIKMNPEAAPLM